MTTRDSIFISYSHKDEEWAQRFNQMLDTHRDEIRVFRDAGIVEGEDWESRLQGELTRAKIALLLVSPDFANSKYITNRELPWILKARKDGLIVNWVEIRPTLVPDELKKLQAFKVQSSNRSLSQLHGGDQDAEIKKISKLVINALDKHPRIPRWELFNRVSDVVQRRFGYSVRQELAIGDHSVVYTADAPGDRVIVKAHARQLFADDRGEDLHGVAAGLETAKTLKHPAFIRLRDWALDTEPQIMVTEFVTARPLRKFMETGDRRLNVDRVRFILQVIAEALSEYHQAKLVYDNIRPSDVLLVKRDEVTWYPRISAFRASQISHSWERVTRNFQINPERLTYIVPEQYEKDAVTQKSDQYALGLLAIEMLQGRPPVQVRHLKDLVDKTIFFENPEAYGGKWLTRSPTLTRIILRMLELKPNKRWRSMADVAAALGGKATVGENNRRLAKESYGRLEDRRKDFFRAFYRNLFTKKKKLKSKFPGDHDWERQHQMLDAAVRGLLNFSEAHAAEEPTILTDTAKKHQELGLTKKDFDAFEEAFIETLTKFNEGSEEMQGAWRACFAPGMSYMKRHATQDRS